MRYHFEYNQWIRVEYLQRESRQSAQLNNMCDEGMLWYILSEYLYSTNFR